MLKFTEWTAARSGASITVTAKDEAGEAVKIVGIHTLAPVDGKVIATDGDGNEFELAVVTMREVGLRTDGGVVINATIPNDTVLYAAAI